MPSGFAHFPAGGLILCAGALRESRLADDALLALGCTSALTEEALLLASELALLPPGASAAEVLQQAGFDSVPRIEAFFQRLGALEAMERLGKLRIARLSELRAADGQQPVWLAGASLGNCWPSADSGPICSCMRLLANGLTGEPESLSLLAKKPSLLDGAESVWAQLTGGARTGIPIALDMSTGTHASSEALRKIIQAHGAELRSSLAAYMPEARCFGRRYPGPRGSEPCPGSGSDRKQGCAAFVFFDPQMQIDQCEAFAQHLAAIEEAWRLGRIGWAQIPEASKRFFRRPADRGPLLRDEAAVDEAAAAFGFFGLAAPAELPLKKALEGWRRMAASWRGIAGRVSSLIRTLPDYAAPKPGVRSGAGFIAFLAEGMLSWMDHQRALGDALHGDFEPSRSTQALLADVQTLSVHLGADGRLALEKPSESQAAAAAALGLPGAFDSAEAAGRLLQGGKLSWAALARAAGRTQAEAAEA